jgi:hypothetical protein
LKEPKLENLQIKRMHSLKKKKKKNAIEGTFNITHFCLKMGDNFFSCLKIYEPTKSLKFIIWKFVIYITFSFLIKKKFVQKIVVLI